VRGDLALHLRLLARPRGVIGLVGVVAGGSAFAAGYLPWYDVRATVDLLGRTGARSVASLAGWQAHPWGWAVPALALLVITTSVLVAIDRPPPGNLLLWAGLGLAGTVVLGGLSFPPVARFDVAESSLRELVAVADRLPKDVGMTLEVRSAVGLWLTLAASALVIATGFASRETA
jgi:hypothetical protein